MAHGPPAARLAGRVAVVTGATGGIGAATCRRLAAEGARVGVTDVALAPAWALAAEVGGAAAELDVTATSSARAALEALTAELGPVEVLVNNAGLDDFGRFDRSDEASWDRLLAVNLRGVLAVSHAALPALRAAEGGRIINVASEAGRLGGHGQAVYSATKGGVIAFTKALAREVARDGLTVNAVAPGPIDTPLMHEARDRLGSSRFDAALAAIPLGRAGTPEDVAAAIAFLASPDAGYLTGAVVPVSGGLGMI